MLDCRKYYVNFALRVKLVNDLKIQPEKISRMWYAG